MQPGGQGKQASLPSQEYVVGFSQANAVKKIGRRCAFSVFHLHLLQVEGSRFHKLPLRLRSCDAARFLAAVNRPSFSRPGLPDAERLTF